MDDLPFQSAAGFLSDVIDGGGSLGRLLDVRQREDGYWDVALLVDGGYAERDDAEGALRVVQEHLVRAYLAEVAAGSVTPAPTQHLAQLGIRLPSS